MIVRFWLALILGLACCDCIGQDFPLSTPVEAEKIAGMQGAQSETQYAKDASGGGYVYLPNSDLDPEDGITPSFAVTFQSPAGMLCLRARVMALNSGTDSFWYRVDHLTWRLSGISEKGVWTWLERKLPLLSDGQHTFYLAPREPLRLDTLELRAEGVSDAPYHIERITCDPSRGEVVTINPPTFFWPDLRQEQTQIQWGRAKSFSRTTTQDAEVQERLFYRPLKPLKPGTYYWHIRTNTMTDWLNTESFQVDSDTPKFIIPSESEWLARVPRQHPRLYLRPEELAHIRSLLKGPLKEEFEQELNQLSALIGRELPEAKWEGPEPTDRKSQLFKKWDSKGLATRESHAVERFAVAYLLTGDERFGLEARRRALHIAEWDPEGFTSHRICDFSNGWILERCAMAYDYCYDLFMPEERQKLRTMLTARAAQIWERYYRSIERRPLNAHGWQHIIPNLGVGSLALFGEVPEAETWFKYFVDIWVNFYPPWSKTDGGWANGIGYYGTAIINSVAMPYLIERATGIDTMQKPWHRHAARFLIYGMPPGICRPGFGDGLPVPPHPKYAFAVERYSRLYSDPYAEWYAQKVGLRFLHGLTLMLSIIWSETPAPQPKAPIEWPKVAVFPDIGWVLSHSDIGNPDNDIAIAFKSSPFGSYSHMHADQNSFVILVGGKHVCIDSGYYIAYGDEHFKGWYTLTKAHNSILVDGEGQTWGTTEAYGRITDFYTSDQYDYYCGDATTAYPRELGLDRFKRHIVYVRPDIFVIYDELEADHPARFDWLLHSYSKMAINSDDRRVLLDEETGGMSVEFIQPRKLSFNQTDQFDVPAVNWRGKGWRRGMVPVDQWHMNAWPEKGKSMRFLTVLHPWHKGGKSRISGIQDLSTEEAAAAKIVLPDGSVTIAFRRDGASGKIAVGGYEADAFAFAVSDKGFCIVKGTSLKSAGKTLFSAKSRATVSGQQ